MFLIIVVDAVVIALLTLVISGIIWEEHQFPGRLFGWWILLVISLCLAIAA